MVFILLADGGFPAIAQSREYLWHIAKKLRTEEKKEQQVVCVKKPTTNNFVYIAIILCPR